MRLTACLAKNEVKVLATWLRCHHNFSDIELQSVLYDEYRTGGTFDSPTQSTVIVVNATLSTLDSSDGAVIDSLL